MLFAKPAAKDGPLTVHVPSPAEDHPSWIRVGAIAALGFVIGVAWPRLAGVRLGPSAPEAAPPPAFSSAASAQPPSGTGAVAVAVPSVTSPPATPAQSEVASAPIAAIEPEPAATSHGPPELVVGHGFVFSCKSSDGESLKGMDCGKIAGLDNVVLPRLRKLDVCPAAAVLSGKVHLVVRADFVRGGLTAEYGRSQGPDAPAGLLGCARTSLAGASIASLPHDHPTYAVAYTLAFGPSSDASGSPSPSGRAGPSASTDSSPQAQQQQPPQVVWDVALVRDAPKTGKIIARLQRGTPLRLGSSKDGWYTVKFGDGFSNDGWVYRAAIGR